MKMNASLIDEQDLCDHGIGTILVADENQVDPCACPSAVEVVAIPDRLTTLSLSSIDQRSTDVGDLYVCVFHQPFDGNHPVIVFPDRIRIGIYVCIGWWRRSCGAFIGNDPLAVPKKTSPSSLITMLVMELDSSGLLSSLK